MTEKWTPEWVDNMNEDVVAKDYWHFAGGGMPLRYAGGGYQHGGYEHGYSHHAMRDYGAEHSIRSSKSSHRSARSARMACCIFLLLLLGALLIAIGVGVMVYYLMRLNHPTTTRHITTAADGSVPLLNVNYTDAMGQNSSEAFLAVSDPLCKEIDRYFRESEYKHKYQGCSIEMLTPDEQAETCECAGIISKAKTTRANFRLVFLGDVSDLHEQVRRVILEKAEKTEGTDYKVLLVDRFIIDISSKFPEGYSTPKPPPAVGVLANLTIWVYNLTYSVDLANPLSTAFQDLAQPFCQDLARIFMESSFSGRYHSCEVKQISPSPDVVIVHIWLTDDDISGIEGGFRRIILDRARNITVNGKIRKIIGTLLITPETGDDGPIIIIPIPVNPLSTIMPTPTSTIGPGYQRYIDMQLYLYGFTYNASFGDSDSSVFKSYAYDYCKELERLLMQSSWDGHFFGCRLYGFYPPITQDQYSYFRTYLGIDGAISYPREILEIIRTYGTFVTVPNSNLNVYRIGDLMVILSGDGITDRINITYLPSTMMMTSTMMTSPTMTPSIMPSIFTSFSFHRPTPTPGQTVTPSASTIVIIYNSTTAFIDGGLYDFNYTPDLVDSTSYRFLALQYHFCNDLDNYLRASILSDQYLSCRIVQFMPRDMTHIQFTLSFQHELTQTLQNEVRRIITTSAPVSQKGGYQVLTIGDLDLIVDLISYTVSVTNYTDVTETAFSPTPTMPIEMTSTPYITYSATLADITCTVVSNIPPALMDKSTDVFKNQEARFCATLEENFIPSVVDSYSYISCYILKFGTLPKTVRFHSIFGKAITSQFKTQILTAINNIPVKTVNGVLGHNVGGVALKPDSCEISLVPVNYTDTMTVFPSIMPTSTVIQPSIDIFHCLRQPCENGGTCVEDNPGWHCQCMPGYTGKDCSINIDDCTPNPCQNDGVCIDGIATFTCRCTTAWAGQRCTIDVDECTTGQHMCGAGGKCVNNPGNYTCECLFGYQGPLCNEEIDACQTSPCENGGTCSKTGPGTFSCNCQHPWNGQRCTQYLGVCRPNPCQHSGTCIDDDTSPRCLCPQEWTGQFCENDVNECLKDPNACNGHGLCVNHETGGFACNCYSAFYGPLWTGDRCELDVDDCAQSAQRNIQLCANGGECVNQQGGYACICPRNFTGANCSQDVNECAGTSSPCLYGATCRNLYGSYECECAPGYMGPRCGTDINECEPPPGPCENDAACYNSFGSFRCDCRTGWTGQFCNEDINECVQGPFICKNGGTCENTDGDYNCNCTDNWSGKQCEIYSELCGSLRCLHGGTCIIVNGLPMCSCPPTRTGQRCETDVNECNLEDPICENNGTCHNLIGSFYCTCKPGYTGDRCENDINECDPSPCENGGHCENTVGSFYCNCTEGWKGIYCGEDIPECTTLDMPCNGHGTCYELRGSYRCDCSLGWTGTFCDIDVNECETTGCMNNGTCNNYPGTWNCTCSPQFTGLFCQTDVDECQLPQPPCKNGATCSNINNGYICYCTDGWTGTDCDVDINECELSVSPCKNGARCINRDGGYDCECTEFWTGKDCDEDINECQLSVPPCKNGATCNNFAGGYECNCTRFWTGKDCIEDINECQLSVPPCRNGATCHNLDGDYDCICTDFWTGKDCDEDIDECNLFGDDACFGNGNCTNEQGSFRCDCETGFKGNDCSQDVDECTELPDQPCKNAVNCTNLYGDYYCECLEGWTGKDCDIDINECTESGFPLCLNNGTCVNTNGSYECNCTEQFMGVFCGEDVNECEAQIPPCKNGGTCVNDIGDYHCECTVEWSGKNCETNIDACSQIECVHGQCLMVGNVYECVCDFGWQGPACDQNINECLDQNTCRNGATCQDVEGGYNCECTSGFQGPQCNEDINECELSVPPCENGATCNNLHGDFECICTVFWTGKNCTIDVKECDDPTTCKNGATCHEQDGGYRCDCTSGFEGPDCGQDVKECLDPSVCRNSATCHEMDGGYRCECAPGFEGPDCGQDVNECVLSVPPCENGATCYNMFGDYDCRCTQFWTGKNCTEDVKECLNSTTCKNGATCQELVGGYDCHCVPGFEGPQCGQDVNECELSVPPCANGATCRNFFGGYECICIPSWTGENCTDDINECERTIPPCKNGATCRNLDGDYECICTDTWTGKDCDEDVRECLDPSVCKNGATCHEMDGSYRCECVPGFEGPDCGQDVKECLDPTLCKNGATCQELVGGYNCICVTGFEGQHCEQDVNECELSVSPCTNGATCRNFFGGYDCICIPSWTGKNCTEDVNECELAVPPCENGATCRNIFGDYECNCTVSWTGKDCDEDVNECLTDPCLNNATCINIVGSFNCSCMEGYMGHDCGQDVDECQLNPCQNGGTCQNTVGSFTCDCSPGYLGPECRDVVQLEIPIQFDLVEDVTELLDTTSPTFQEYAQEFCEDMTRILTAAPGTDFDNYNDCEVTSYQEDPMERDKINWVAKFIIGAASSTGQLIKDYILSLPTQVFGDVNAIQIGNNYIYESDHISMVPVQFDLADDIASLPDLLNTESTLFKQYSDAFCNHITNIMENSGLFLTFNNCTVTSFGTGSDHDQINWTANFRGPNPGLTADGIKSFILSTQPVITVGDANAVRIGNNNVFMSDIISTRTVQLQLLDDIGGQSDLLDPTSQLFMEYSQEFCNHISAILSGSSEYSKFQNCTVEDYGTEPDQITWTGMFLGTGTGITPEGITDYILTTQPKIVIGDSNSVKIGNNYVYHSPYTSEFTVSFDLVGDVVANPELLDSNSQLFSTYSEAFCNQTSTILVSSGLFQTFQNCTVVGYGTDPDRINWTASFLGAAPGVTADGIKEYILTTQPTEIVDDANAIKIGNNNIYESDYITTIPVQFRLVDDIGSQPELLDRTSQMFYDYSRAFCEDVSTIMSSSGDFPKFRDCAVTSFSQNPDQITWTADFLGTAQGITAEDIKTYILDSLPKLIVGDAYVAEVGNNHVHASDIITPFTIEFQLVDDLSSMPDLSNTESQLFMNYSQAFCEQISDIMKESGIFQKFTDCSVMRFETGPYKIIWTANFLGTATSITSDGIKSYIMRTQPTTVIGDSNAIPIGNNNIFQSDYISTSQIQFELLDDIAGSLSDLLNPQSTLFATYARNFCDHISDILSTSVLYQKFRNCAVSGFGTNPDQINWTAEFLGSAPSVNHIKDYLLTSQPNVTVGDNVGIKLGNNTVLVSELTTTFPIQFMLTDDVGSQQDLLDPQSQLFLDYSVAFCNHIKSILDDSGQFPKFKDCAVTNYGTGPDQISWTASFLGPAQGITVDTIKEYILTSQPTEIDGDASVIRLGNNNIYVSDITTFPIQFRLVDEITTQLLDTKSLTFSQYSLAFCEDINSIMTSTAFFPQYRECRVVNYTDSPATINWLAHFDGTVPATTGNNVIGFIRESQPKVILRDSYVIEIGLNNVYYADYITTNTISERMLLNFTYSPDLQDPASARFQNLQASFCQRVDSLIGLNSDIFIDYSDCSIINFTQSISGENFVNFRLRFTGSQDAAQNEQEFYSVLERDLPKLIFGRNQGYQLGDLILFYDTLGSLTSVSMTYDLINLTYSAALADSSSAEFIQHAKVFCDDLLQIVQGQTVEPPTCTVKEYRNGDPFVKVNFTLEFPEVLDVATMQNFISGKIFNERPRVRVGDYVGNVVGDVVVYYDSLLDYIDIVYDGWIVNVTQDAIGLGGNENVFNTSTDAFRDVEAIICNAYTEKLTAAEPRYLRCFIPEIRDETPDYPSVTTTISLLFEDREPLLENEIKTVLQDFAAIPPIQGKQYYFVGSYALHLTNYEEIKVNVSDYFMLFTTTTENPLIVYSTVQMQFQISNFTLTNALANESSPEFLQTETEFCTWADGFDDIFTNGFPGTQILLSGAKYINCSLINFSSSDGADYVHVELVFRGEVQSGDEETLRATLIEYGHRIDLNGNPAITVQAVQIPSNSTSPTYLYFQSLQTGNIISDVALVIEPTTAPPLRTMLP